jgi:hypothetical protein
VQESASEKEKKDLVQELAITNPTCTCVQESASAKEKKDLVQELAN